MNPRAVTFTPGTFSPEPRIEDDSRERLEYNQIPTGPQGDKKDKESSRTGGALDPENYDTMFPSLKTANQRADPPTDPEATSRASRKQRREAKKFERKRGKKIMELSSGPRPSTGSSLLSSRTEESYQEVSEADTSEVLSEAEHDEKPIILTASPTALSQFKDISTDLVQMAQNMPPTPKPEHEIAAGQHAPSRATSAAPSTSSIRMPTKTPPIPTPLFPSPFTYPGATSSPLPWSPDGYLFYYAQNPLSYGPNYMPAAMSQAPQFPWNQPFTQSGPIWPVTGPFNPPGAPVPWQAAATQHLASTIGSNTKARGTTQVRNESRPSSRGHPRGRSAVSKISKPKQQPIESSKDYGNTMVRPASRTNAPRWLAGNRLSGEKEKDACLKVEGKRPASTPALEEDGHKLAGLAIPMAIREQNWQNKTPPGEVFNFTNDDSQGAPKAPRVSPSQRNPVARGSLAQPQSNTGIRSVEIGTWSQSKRWVSAETKERTAFQKMLTNLHYMGADKSPFIPQSPAELTALKADAAEARRMKLLEKVGRLISKPNGEQNGQMVEAIFQGKRLEGDSSPVFGIDTCFNKEQDTSDGRRVDWPSLAELKEEGDKRAVQHGRYFPLPRLNIAASQASCEEHDQVYSPNGSTQWSMKEIKLGSAAIAPKCAESAYNQKDAQKFNIEEVPASLEEIINHINDQDTKMEGSTAG